MVFGAWLCLLAPLGGALAITLAGQLVSRRIAGYISTLTTFLAFGGALIAFFGLWGQDAAEREELSTAYTWLAAGDFEVGMEILVDPLSTVMMLVVSGVGALIVWYSMGYMAGEDEERRYFAYMSLFVFAMLLLVQAGNFLLLLVGWGLVGLASYLLIGFWHERPEAVAAAKKGFIMNAFGDATMALAFFVIIWQAQTLDFAEAFGGTEGMSSTALNLVALGLLGGAVAKSAQIPLHTWLPDAMEGPTPVSALIHAATMVTAGVYLIARTFPLFELAPTAADISAIIGTATLVFAATVALVVTDLKRVIAYSTISQIGYMVLGVSIAAYGAGLFHLMTHAFFKALLFMGAGSVIGAMAGAQDLDRMGGFRRAMPFTFVTFTVGALALAGFPIMSGFFSKDEILAYAIERGSGFVVLAVVGYIAAFLTAFYAFRMVFRVFFGDPVPEARELEEGHLAHGEPMNPMTGEPEDTDVGFPGPEQHVAEQSWPMKVAMATLAVLAIVGGYVGVPALTDTLEHFLEPTFEESRYHEVHPSDGAEWAGLAAGGLVSIAAIALAYVMYVRRAGVTLRLRDRFGAVHDFLVHKWYFDELYDALFVRPFTGAGSFGRRVIEADFVQGFIVGGATGIVRVGTSFARAIQTGYLRAYALLLLVGLAAIALYFLLASA